MSTDLINSVAALLPGLKVLTAELLACQSKHYLQYMDQQNQLQQSNLSEPDALCNFSVNKASTDLNHKPETESEIPQGLDRRGLKQSIKILGNGDNILYRLGNKVYLLERTEF